MAAILHRRIVDVLRLHKISHEQYLVVFINVLNLVRIGNAVVKICLFQCYIFNSILRRLNERQQLNKIYEKEEQYKSG